MAPDYCLTIKNGFVTNDFCVVLLCGFAWPKAAALLVISFRNIHDFKSHHDASKLNDTFSCSGGKKINLQSPLKNIRTEHPTFSLIDPEHGEAINNDSIDELLLVQITFLAIARWKKFE